MFAAPLPPADSPWDCPICFCFKIREKLPFLLQMVRHYHAACVFLFYVIQMHQSTVCNRCRYYFCCVDVERFAVAKGKVVPIPPSKTAVANAFRELTIAADPGCGYLMVQDLQ